MYARAFLSVISAAAITLHMLVRCCGSDAETALQVLRRCSSRVSCVHLLCSPYTRRAKTDCKLTSRDAHTSFLDHNVQMLRQN